MAKIIKNSLGNFLVIWIIFLMVVGWIFSGQPQVWNEPPIPPKIQEARAADTLIYITDTASTTWTVPSDWNSASNSIEAIGAGGNGGLAVGTSPYASGGGGGGGEYRKAVDVTLTPDSTVNINIPSGGDGSGADGAWLKNNAGTKVIEATNGGNASGMTAGSGGTNGTGTAANYDGGSGGSGGSHTSASAGAGGGGSAGPGSGTTGVGRAGGDGYGGTGRGGGGGGGSNGESSTAGQTPTSSTGGTGGNGTGGTGGGTGGASNSGGGDGTNGGGGGGGGNATGANNDPGGAGGCDTAWDSTHGACGGGGGGGSASGTAGEGDKDGGPGGTYGGGGGGCGVSGALQGGECDGTGVGGQGIIVITYSAITNATPDTPVLDNTPAFPNMLASTTTPVLGGFSATDDDGDDVEFQVEWDTDASFGSPATGTTATTTSGATTTYTIGSALSEDTVYWWRVKARDPAGSNNWSSYSNKRSITVSTSISFDQWFQTTGDQFDTDTLTDVATTATSVQIIGW